MRTASRTVRHLRLRAADRSAVHRAALLFEDALRTASLPDAAGRIVLVRKLALGRIDSRAPPQTLALTLERTLARLETQCVHAATPGAADAAAVWFRDSLDAHTRLALRLASGDTTDAWYWPLAVPAWRPATSGAEALRLIALSVAALPEASVALPKWAAALAAAGHVERLIGALRTEDVALLTQAARLRIANIVGYPRRFAGAPAQRARAHLGEPLANAAAPEYADSRPVSSSTLAEIDADPRRALVRALMRVAGASEHGAIAVPSVSARLDRTDRSRTRRRVAPEVAPRSDARRALASNETDQPTASAAPEIATSATLLQPDRPHDEPSSAHVPRANLRRSPKRAHADDASGTRRDQPSNIASLEAPAFATPGADTCAGGLLFLLPVLQRLGYAEWLDAQPQWQPFDIARHVLASVLTRLRVAPEDPAWQLGRCARIPRRGPRRFVAPPAWRDQVGHAAASPIAGDDDGERSLWDGTGRLLLGAWRGPCPRALLADWRRAQRTDAPTPARDRVAGVTEAWVVAVRRWLRRHAGLGLSDLVLRPATLAWTPTHADLWFELRAVELRIRRAGLDLDPGWVPWFGRVVTFHYDR